MEQVLSHLSFLYGSERAMQLMGQVGEILARHRARIPRVEMRLSQRDSMLITYADQVHRGNDSPLKTLGEFCHQRLKDVVSAIHILPFYPWTSDDGFSVVDYREVAPEFGTWQDVQKLEKDFQLMFDAVINHVSVESEWFREFLRGHPVYRDYFITVDGSPDLSRVVRPRALPLLTSFETAHGARQVWTTFSSDQVDLNYGNPVVLLEILDVLLEYVARGAGFLRMDAIAYLWKEIGTTCINLPQAHHLIQFFRAALDEVAPHVQLITETNIPHIENISYFGNGYNEAQLVYNFALPPLVLHAFHTGDASTLSKWAATLDLPSERTTFFNFLSSHDGIGLNPTRGILSPAEIDHLVEKTLEHGGLISYKDNPDGTKSPYEMNINYFDALSNPQGNEPVDLQVARFMAAQAIMLSLVGLPGIYFHSLFGSRGWPQGVKLTGRHRTINREKCDYHELTSELSDSKSLRARVFGKYRQLLAARGSCTAFHPHGRQQVLDLHRSVFGLTRESRDGRERVLCLHNVSSAAVSFATPLERGTDLVRGEIITGANIILEPYQVRWILS